MKRYRYYLFIFLIAGLFVVPQLWTQKMILGADALFHYNRFMKRPSKSKLEILVISFRFSAFSNLAGSSMRYMDRCFLTCKGCLSYLLAAGFVIRYFRIF